MAEKYAEELMERIGYTFHDPSLLRLALTHSSYANESKGGVGNNERLEFLGDAVLGMVTAEYLFNTAHVAEGEMTKRRAALVCEKALFSYAQSIGLNEFLLLGRGEKMTGGDSRPSILSDAFEAVTAAIYLDGGMAPAKKFLLRFIEKEAGRQNQTRFHDYKTALQEIVQQNPEERLEYVLTDESGPDHNKKFTFGVFLNSNQIGTGTARSKKEAEQLAAREALRLMGYDN